MGVNATLGGMHSWDTVLEYISTSSRTSHCQFTTTGCCHIGDSVVVETSASSVSSAHANTADDNRSAGHVEASHADV